MRTVLGNGFSLSKVHILSLIEVLIFEARLNATVLANALFFERLVYAIMKF